MKESKADKAERSGSKEKNSQSTKNSTKSTYHFNEDLMLEREYSTAVGIIIFFNSICFFFIIIIQGVICVTITFKENNFSFPCRIF